MDADDCARIIEGVAAVLDLLSRPRAMPWTTRRRSTSCLRRDVGMSAWHSKL